MKDGASPPDAGVSSGPKCPTCGNRVDRSKAGRAAPFCSPRCQQLDLGRWLHEDYTISHHAVPQQELATSQRLQALIKTGQT